MFGLGFTFLRENESGGLPETIYLRTHRRGEAGQKLRKLLRSYHQLELQQTKAATEMPVVVAQAQQCVQNEDIDGLKGVAERQNILLAGATAAAEERLKVAEEIAELVLCENYPAEKLEQILDKLTDRDLFAIVGTVELGEMPRDFFQSLEARQKLISTGRSGASREASSSRADTPAKTLKPER